MKKIALFLVVVLLILAGYIGYLFFFKTYDTADKEVDQLAEGEYKLSLPQETGSSALSAEEIIEPYRTTYKELIGEAENRIDGIVSEAEEEFVEKKQSGEDISYSYFFNKYNSAADRLEASTDEAFEEIYKPLKAQLEEQGYKSEAAEDLKREYQKTKKGWRASLMQSAKESF
ncbi:hypothetical protein [Halobacillus mangrovi]|uniref:Uncharacterized protein n=1 Tax=Halobacillus mangrovi TaxID=402384 RepID=A0A1W5ZTA4_9BACI|nr:hypothetical protein [Halobacillus mangrovi]ARI76509.1 hypothetical protein HM131_06510 [Halobacillus mangrovi]